MKGSREKKRGGENKIIEYKYESVSDDKVITYVWVQWIVTPANVWYFFHAHLCREQIKKPAIKCPASLHGPWLLLNRKKIDSFSQTKRGITRNTGHSTEQASVFVIY